MSLARLVVTAVYVEGRTKSEVARDYGVSRRWVQKLAARYDAEGEAGLEPRSRRPRSSPQRISPELEEQIVGLRKSLAEEGLDAGAATIAFHLAARHGRSPAVSTIWRVLTRRGFVTPQPASAPGPATQGSRPTSPTRAGSWTSPTGSSPTAAARRSSTSSMTTPGC